MSFIVPNEYESKIKSLFDKYLAIVICGRGSKQEEITDNISTMIKNLYYSIFIGDVTKLSNSITELESIFNGIEYDQYTQRAMDEFIEWKKETNKIQKTLDEIINEIRIIGDENFQIFNSINSLPDKLKVKRKVDTNKEYTIPEVPTEILSNINKLDSPQQKVIELFLYLPANTELSNYEIHKLIKVDNGKWNPVYRLTEKGKLKTSEYTPPHSSKMILYSLPNQ